VIHVAGSKGKGTTCYYCNHLLNTHQTLIEGHKKIGCYTSPHQVDVRERIQINNTKIPKVLFSKYVRTLHNRIQSLKLQSEIETPPVPGYPGFLALLAIYIFVSEKVDVAIVETGIGGEKDSTNVFPNPVATGITTIGLDHVPTLGSTLEEIAWQKAGIFKPGSPAIAVEQDEAVLNVLRIRAREKHAAGDLQVVFDEPLRAYGVAVYPDRSYQRKNAALAIALAECYLSKEYPDDPMTATIARSLRDVVLPGRCQVIADKNNAWFVSIAHSELSVKETVAWFKETMQQAE
jgi:folylpolyglutamate synthase